MSHTDVEAVARELLSAFETGAMVAIPPSQRPGFDLNTAYEVEAALKRLRETAGHKAVGRKVGYANKAMWRVLKLETLVWAHMYDDTVHYSEGNSSERNSAALTLAHPRSLKIEPEIVFGLKQPVVTDGAEAPDAAAALASTDWMAVGFEIIDCPFPEWQFQPSDFVASFGLHAALVVGDRVKVPPDRIAALVEELGQFKVRVSCSSRSKNGGFVEEGSGRNSLRSPALCLAELGRAIVRRFPTDRGDLWTVEVEGLSSSLSLPPLTLQLT
jgi:2-keto-4-pentenoate hydratase